MSNHVVLQLNPSRHNSRNSEGSFVTLRGGRLLFAYTKFGQSSDDGGAAVIAARHSDDGGLTWSARDRLLVPLDEARNVMSVTLLRLMDGRIALLYLRKDAQWCMPLICFSEDEGKSFTPPTSILPVPGYHVVNNDRMVQLSTGRLVIPVGLHRYRGFSTPGQHSTPATGWDPGALIFCYLSDDGGHHWFESLTSNYPYFPNGHGLQEPGLVELKNGKLWGWARASATGLPSKYATQWQMFSRDQGMTWTAAQPSAFASPCSPLSVKRVPATGDLLAVWNDHAGHFKLPAPQASSWGRTPLVAALSSDEGRTWHHHKIIEDAPDHGYCYTAIHFVDDAVLLAYCAGGASSHSVLDTLRVRRLTVDELDG